MRIILVNMLGMALRSPARLLCVLACSGMLLVAASCAATGETSAGGPASPAGGTSVPGGPCPVEAVRVVVSVSQWADLVQNLGGLCAKVTTVLTDSATDPHDFEPSAGDVGAFGDAQLVVMNGAGYDGWAAKAVDTLSRKPAVVDAGQVVRAPEGANPHLWYSPDAVGEVGAAVTSRLREVAPAAAGYFDERAADWQVALQPYRDAIASVKARSEGRTFGATESVYDLMARAVGLRDATPAGYRQAAANESEAAPGDIHEFSLAMRDGSITVLLFNTQTEGAIPEQIREAARSSNIPVVAVSESAPPDTSFVRWQVKQLNDLYEALGPPST
jgi:zinc/manganese transport system substrate-binding protein